MRFDVHTLKYDASTRYSSSVRLVHRFTTSSASLRIDDLSPILLEVAQQAPASDKHVLEVCASELMIHPVRLGVQISSSLSSSTYNQVYKRIGRVHIDYGTVEWSRLTAARSKAKSPQLGIWTHLLTIVIRS